MGRVYDLFWRTLLRRALSSALTLVLAFGAAYAVWDKTHTDRSCPAGERPKGSKECIGVAGDGYDFDVPQLHQVTAAISRENDSLKPGSYVTVALLQPFTAQDAATRTSTVEQAQGAYLSQYKANRQSNDQSPKIRLVLANVGANTAHWDITVRRLKGMTGAPDQLRAVAGVAFSNAPTQAAVTQLTQAGIPVVGSTMTADSLANARTGPPRYPGLARVSPTNQDEARALIDFGRPDAKKAVLVKDTRTTDEYTDTLGTAFSRFLAGSPYEPGLFTSPPDPADDGTTANTFQQITHLLCDSDADTVFFAGRHPQLRQFVNALGERGCQQRAFTVTTGDEGALLSADPKFDKGALKRKVSVRYAALAHPDAWTGGPGTPATGGSPTAYRTFADLVTQARRPDVGPIGPLSLLDGEAIAAYDSLESAVTAIRQATVKDQTMPLIADVATQWPLMKGSLRVEGASGWICLGNEGNPYDKAVPVVELNPDGTPHLLRVAWPEGRPPQPSCLPPAP
ncbi:ABC transporter substrate-binding protein [Streptomyces sp. NPDC048696]|uniref:ABC transporter substrate-binding protein n=1 Tax=Streptomyces sp. NPDC048696 TaxID=3365585 RepID=UPI003721E425